MGTIENKLKAKFPPDAISFRANSVKTDGTAALALAYIDARDVMNRLDEVCGINGWQVRYSHAETKTICEIGIKIDNEWIWKANGAGDTDVEAEKGATSDAFKRAAVLWGIGRYLYQDEYKNLWVECESKEYNGKFKFIKWRIEPHIKVKQAKASKSTIATQPIVAKSLDEKLHSLLIQIKETKNITDLEVLHKNSKAVRAELKSQNEQSYNDLQAKFAMQKSDLLNIESNEPVDDISSKITVSQEVKKL
jgi:hypothetical protein